MAELVVVGFEGKHRAAEVLDQLQAMNVTATIDLKDAVAVYRTDDGSCASMKASNPRQAKARRGVACWAP